VTLKKKAIVTEPGGIKKGCGTSGDSIGQNGQNFGKKKFNILGPGVAGGEGSGGSRKRCLGKKR